MNVARSDFIALFVYKVRESRVHERTGGYLFVNCFRLEYYPPVFVERCFGSDFARPTPRLGESPHRVCITIIPV
jgi:hypothetical protein